MVISTPANPTARFGERTGKNGSSLTICPAVNKQARQNPLSDGIVRVFAVWFPTMRRLLPPVQISSLCNIPTETLSGM